MSHPRPAKPGQPPPDDAVAIRLLGGLRLAQDGVALDLPASKKTRALLGYLVATGVPQSRQHLCDLLWEGPDDPRAALRWSLAKLRPLLDTPGVRRLATGRETIRFGPAGATTDTRRLAALFGTDLRQADLASLIEAAELLQGEFLSGLDLPRCYRFHAWLMAERQRYGQYRRDVLETLVARLAEDPERALPHAHALVAADPLSEPAHAALVRLLVAARRPREAEQQYRYARELLQRELGGPLAGELRPPAHYPTPTPERQPAPPPALTVREPLPPIQAPSGIPLVGRVSEQTILQTAIDALAAGRRLPPLLLTGEPGIGKTRLLAFAAERGEHADLRVAIARCFEAEMIRPYGLWSELRQDGGQLHSLAPPLVPGPAPRDSERVRLFEDAATELARLAAEAPMLVLLDDLQWIDEGSAALLHYLIRRTDLPALFVGAARTAEIDDNPWGRRLLASLERTEGLQRLQLKPLAPDDLVPLLGAGVSLEQVARVHRASGGNPLFALSFVGGRVGVDLGIDGFRRLVEQRLAWLDAPGSEAIQCAAAVGRPFEPALLSRALERSELEIDRHVEALEQRGLLTRLPDGRLDFTHDLVRQTIYDELPQTRRRLLHRRLAGALSASVAADDRLHGDLARHAALAGDHLLAAEAYAAAGERCLAAFADQDAIAAADLGLAEASAVPRPADRIRVHTALLAIKLYAIAGTDRSVPPALVDELSTAIADAESLGERTVASNGAVALSWASHRANDMDRARQATLRAEAISRMTDEVLRCQQLANTGRCLLDVEADIEQARTFLTQASGMADQLGLSSVELDWGRGLLARWDGDLEAAHASIVRAVEIARMREGGWRELECLIWLAKLGLERGTPAETVAACDRIAEAIGRRQQAEPPAATALRALARNDLGEFDRSLLRLRAHDDKANLAYVLNHAAVQAVSTGATAQAAAYAGEALAAARAVNLPTEIAVATALQLQSAAKRRQPMSLARFSLPDREALSARARIALDRIGPRRRQLQRSLQRHPAQVSTSR